MNNQGRHEGRVLLAASDITFAYPARQIFGRWSHGFGSGLTWLQGRNGDGKSTLLRILAGSLIPRMGSLIIHGACSNKDALEYRRNLFWCGPGELPLAHLKPAEYFGFMAHLYPDFDNDDLQRHVEAFALHPHLASPLASLSTGTQRKVWISAALAAKTCVMLLDEPFNALDASSAQHLRLELKNFPQDAGRALVIASHEDIGSAGDSATILNLSPDGVRNDARLIEASHYSG